MRAILVLVLASACATDPMGDDGSSGGGGGGKADGDSSYQLSGYDETLLAADSRGSLAVLHVGATFAAKKIVSGETVMPTSLRSHGGKFYALFPTGTLLVIDPSTGAIDETIAVPAKATDLEWLSDTAVYVSTPSAVVRVSLDTASVIGTIDLSGLRGSATNIEARYLRKVGTRLYVQLARNSGVSKPERAAVVVVDTATDSIERTIELEGVDPGNGRTILGREPSFHMAHDDMRDRLYVAATGPRGFSTGGMFRIDTTTGLLADTHEALGGFQGINVIGPPWDSMYMIAHTSTPVASSHLFPYRMDASGDYESLGGGTLIDNFDGTDQLVMNSAGTLVAMGNNCAAGFCISGAGISFINAQTHELLPKLLEDKIGFQPSQIAFLE